MSVYIDNDRNPGNPTRAALERLRKRIIERRNQVSILANTTSPRTPLDGAIAAINDVALPEIDNELAALASAPEPAGQAASPGLVEVRCDRVAVSEDGTKDAYWFGADGRFVVVADGVAMFSDRKNGVCVTLGGGEQAAERARKPDDRIATLRKALIDTVNATNARCTDTVSDDFLAELPGEVAAMKRNLEQRAEQAEAALAAANAELLKAGIAASAYESTADAVRQLRECMEAAQKLTREAEKEVAAARQEGLRELRGKIPTSMVYSGYPFVYVSEVEKLIDRLLADPAPPAAEPDEEQHSEVLRDWIERWSGRKCMEGVLAELCRSELARRGGGR